MNIETNLEKIANANKTGENKAFRAYIKKFPSVQIDKIAHRINREVVAAIDCKQCGNCCRKLEPEISEAEAAKLASFLQLSPADFIADYTEKVKPNNDWMFMKAKPCIFLSNNCCTRYENRPDSCKDFPGLQRPHIKYRMNDLIYSYSFCPIVFNVVELMKSELHFVFES